MKRTTTRHISQNIALQRPPDVQTLLRLFAVGISPRTPMRLTYLQRPAYRTLDARPITLAGDGNVFIWVHGRVPGFRDYENPPGDGYVRVSQVLNDYRRGHHGEYLPGPAGPWKGSTLDTVFLAGKPARIRRADLARLAVIDTVEAWGLVPHATLDASRFSIGGGATYDGGSPGWKSVGFTWIHGTAHGGGIILCAEPEAVRLLRARRRRAEGRRAAKAEGSASTCVTARR